MSYERSSITELATELGVLPDRIYSWRKEFADYGSASFLGHGVERFSDEGRLFNTLATLNATIHSALEIHNNTPFCGRNYSRREQFEEIGREVLRPLIRCVTK